VRKPPSLPPPPPPKPRTPVPKPEKALDEVERAISLLDGRHPEHERVKRETAAAAELRRRALVVELAERARKRRRRIVVAASVVVAAGAVGAFVWKFTERTAALRASLERVSAPFVSRGFTPIATNDLSAKTTLEADVPGVSCYVAVTDAPTVRIAAGAIRTEGPGSVMWCSCAPDHVVVDAVGGNAPAAGLLRVDARTVGGPLARPWSDIPAGAWGGGGDECADEIVDGWIAAGHCPKPFLDETWEIWLGASPARAALRRAGFHVVSGVAADKPFGVVDGGADSCLLAIATVATDKLSLRALGGAKLVESATGALAWCDATGGTRVVRREGKSRVLILAAPGTRVGGLLGTREVAAAAHVDLALSATWLRDDDLAWDASALLRASGVPEVGAEPVSAVAGAKLVARVVALGVSPSATLAHDPPDVAVACDPPSASREQVCAPGVPLAWWRKSDSPAALAHGDLPFWLTSLETRREPDALARIPELLALSRRLTRDGFEPTLFEGAAELADGVRVVGRAGEDEVVAVGLAPRAPWVFPYSPNIPWDLGDEPRVVTLRPGDSVKMVSSPPSSAPVDKRRTVVFRHVARP
jgi:hypothetical protein